ncbi:MAG: DUF2953 domain-containing protein [Clostridia bacterium]|nr:DUF2953 domain-containing protein [Clostridia bacterium]
MTVLLIILAIIVIILVIPLGVNVAYIDGGFSLAAWVAGINYTLFPKKAKKAKKEKPPKPKKEKKPKKPKKRRPEDDIEANKKEKIRKLFELAKIGLDALGRFRRKLTVNRLRLYAVIASKDPYNTAVIYGYVNSALPVLMPLLERAFNIKNSDIRTEASFETTEPEVDFEMTLTTSIGKIFCVVFAAMFAYLKFLIRTKRETRREKLAEERMDRDGTAEPNV